MKSEGSFCDLFPDSSHNNFSTNFLSALNRFSCSKWGMRLVRNFSAKTEVA